MSIPLEDYALVGDLHTAALIARNGSIDWLCLPRFDSPACFAALLGDEKNGRWMIAPQSGGTCARRRYRGETLILESEWDTPDGSVRVIDFMPLRGEAADIVRIVEGVSGRVPMHMELALRFDYGHITPWVRHIDGELDAVAGPDAAWLRTPVHVEGKDFTTQAQFEVAVGDRVPFVLTHRPSHLPAAAPVDAEKALRETEKFWLDWISHCSYDGRWKDAVHRSLILLKALTYTPTGGIVAAATTSLPEDLGGDRNWDYRYSWLRDATFTLHSLLDAGYTQEAKAWREWLLRSVAGDPADLQIMYGVDGTRRLTELTVDWLPGYANSKPVRVGNAAAAQFQLDVWGEVLDGLHFARESGLATSEDAWELQRALLDFLEGHWQDPDNSLWEVRGARQQFVHSKVMACVGFDRAIYAVEKYGLEGPADQWRQIRQRIHDEVCEKGYDASRNTFTQYYGSKGLDAALLLIPRVGFLDWSDKRVIGTIEAIQKDLMQDGFLLRYRQDTDGGVDGLSGHEGAFLMCTFWLADALHGIGRKGEALDVFERLLRLQNDVGILSEEYDPQTKRLIGNMPQAFTHVGLVNTAMGLNDS